MTEKQDDRDTVVELVKRARSAMLTTMTPDGDHVSRPMAVQEAEFDGDLWFFADENSDKIRDITAHPRVNVALANDSKNEWTSIAGTAEIVHDRAKAEQLWSKPLETWFPDGLDTPGLTLIKVQGDTAEYWDAPTSRIKLLLGMGRAIRRNDPDEFPVDNRTVDL
ncbi:pyridoxamine 5'-phosphate oxidase [Nakamurella sp. YIM 132087]|uniref:Pyridoxamine 5'-phosphate oxidase n=1 Tax=Nakamurella alba TaxID=2665158 RepID=A0A7K1FMV4_9ACTN|nr:pyridoxamine 5'-phosphate oxidase family protein [Nakamurella alba]MTD14649.1 pyridoxamine 5'-phosphate oxidase [Nakamurella alba]